MRAGVCVFAAALALAGARGAIAQAVPEAGRPTVDLTLYGWLQSLDGRVGAGPFAADVSSSFRDTIDKADTVTALMGRVEVRHHGFGVFLDATYTSLGFDKVSMGPLAARADTTLFLLEFGGAAQLAAGGEGLWALDALAGGRWTRIRNEVGLIGGPSATQTADWVDPFIGLRLRGRFAERFEYSVRGDIGGFGIGSDFTWQAIAGIGYRFEVLGTEATALIGYRALSQDNGGSRFRWDMTVHGPVVGLNLRF